MASLYLRGRIWWVKFVGPDGHPVQRSTGETGKNAAKREAANIEAGVRENAQKADALPLAFQALLERAANDARVGRLTLARTEELLMDLHLLANPNYKVVSLDKHLRDWIASQERHVAPKTAAVYWDMHRRVTGALGKRAAAAPVGKLTKKQVEAALMKIHKGDEQQGMKQLTAATANADLRALRRALESAAEQGLTLSNPAKHVKPLKEKDSKIVAPFTKEEFQTLLRYARTKYTHDEWEGAILIAGHTGLRFGDVLSLTRKNIEGDKLVVTAKKTDQTTSIPMTPPVLRWVGDKKGAFFPILGPMGPGSLSTTFTRIMARAGVPRDIEQPGGKKARRSFHSLRHSFTSWLASGDVHSDIRKKLTGHKSDGIHEKYTHPDDDALKKAMNALPPE